MIYPGVKRTMCRKGHSSPVLEFTVAHAIITLMFTFVSLFIQQSVDFPLLNHRFVYNCGRKRYNKSERRIATPFVLKIEQTAGYYECAKCGHRYVPTYKSVFMAAHVNRTRHMRCPKCGKKSWQKKVLSKE